MTPSLTPEEIEEFRALAAPVLAHPVVRHMDAFVQHGQTSCLAHCVAVAWVSFALYKRRGLHGQEAELVRGALLHDFFLYDWHEPGHGCLHGFTHPIRAARNAERYFALDPVEREIIRKHMWPLTVIPPHSRAALIVSLADKRCTTAEMHGDDHRDILAACGLLPGAAPQTGAQNL